MPNKAPKKLSIVAWISIIFAGLIGLIIVGIVAGGMVMHSTEKSDGKSNSPTPETTTSQDVTLKDCVANSELAGCDKFEK